MPRNRRALYMILYVITYFLIMGAIYATAV